MTHTLSRNSLYPNRTEQPTSLPFYQQEMNLTLHKFDELDSLINGIEYIEDNNLDSECYFFLNPRSPNHCQKVTYDFSNPYPFLVSLLLLPPAAQMRL